MHPSFRGKYPLSTIRTLAGLLANLTPVSTAPGVEHEGFDDDAVKSALGPARYAAFMVKLMSGAPFSGAVFSCGHRTKNGVEVHCIYAQDLEAFLKAGG